MPDRTASPSHLLYLHGFRSSPRSFKAQQLRAWLAAEAPGVHWWCPQLAPSPRQALELVMDGIVSWPAHASAVVGSSLGGFYATIVAERTGWPAVVLNPAVDPARDLAPHVGVQTAYHSPSEQFDFGPEHVAQLQAMTPTALTRLTRYLAIIAKGDELLDWREMRARYRGASVHLIDGSDHALSDFDRHLPRLLRFLHLGD
jgi:uncharacterized protein